MTCEVSADMLAGGCSDSQCLPYWSECFLESDNFASCDAVCQAEGKTCEEAACNGYTWIQAGISVCTTGNSVSVLHSDVPCEGAIVWEGSFGRCCCS